MTTFGQVREGRVLSHFTTDRPIKDFPDIAHELHELPDNVQDGWVFDGKTAAPYAPTPEELRQQAIDAAIDADAIIIQLKAMTPAQFDTWWSANVTNAAQAIAFMKRLARVVIRRVL